MKSLIVATAAVVGALGLTLAPSAQAKNYSTAEIVKICNDKSSASAQNFCNGYAQGVYDFYVSSLHPKANPPYICIPKDGPTRQNVINSWLGWAENFPQYAQLPAADSMVRYLAGTFPCK
jgi:hypothetical protein